MNCLTECDIPTSVKEVEKLGWDYIDVIIFTGDAFVDHPSFGTACIARWLQKHGYRIAVVPQPNWRDDLRDFRKLGAPRLYFAVNAGAMDSMVNHYTAARRLRHDDAYTPEGRAGQRPDRAVTVYSRILKRLWPDVPVVIGGVEASLRRLTHYDYWDDRIMPSVLVGDMNATPDDAASATFRTCWNDAYQAVDARFISGPVGTFNGHKTSTDLSVSTARIDYIYTRGSLALKSYRVDNSIYGGIYPSDHCPVSIQVDFNYDAPEPPQIEGAGTESDPWQINSTADWNAVAESINGAEADATYQTTHFYALTADIDFKGQSLLPISYAASTIYFQGEFDGRGHTIRNVTMTASGSSFGLFGASDGRIHDLNVEDLSLSTAFKTAGGVVGTNRGVIDGVTFRGQIVGTGEASVLGGIAGQNQGVIVNCGNRGGSIEAVNLNSGVKGENLGGIVGQISKGSDGVGNYVINCYSWIERIASNNNNLGGIVGIISDDSFVINCYATLADVSQNDSYASSVGYNKKGNVWNVYGNEACPSGQKNADWIVGNDSKKDGSVWAESVGALLSLDEMKSGAVTVPSSGKECASMVEALNTGAELYDQLPDGTLPTKPVVSLREWVASDTYPVLK